MRISERKERLRRRGVVPVAQQQEAREARPAKVAPSARKGATYTAGTRPAARAAGKGGTKGAAVSASARPRRQMSAGYQLTIGALYITFAPLLLAFYVAQLRNPKVKSHPGPLEIGMTILFLLFGVWQVSQGLRTRRRQEAEKAQASAAAPARARRTGAPSIVGADDAAGMSAPVKKGWPLRGFKGSS